MYRFLRACLVLSLFFPAGLAAQEDDLGARLERLERQVRSLRFAIQAAEQRGLELTFLFQAQGLARYEKIRYTSSARRSNYSRPSVDTTQRG